MERKQQVFYDTYCIILVCSFLPCFSTFAGSSVHVIHLEMWSIIHYSRQTGFLVEFVSGMIKEMTPTTDDPHLTTLKEEVVEMLDSDTFGK